MKTREEHRGNENKGGVGKRSDARNTRPEKEHEMDGERCAGEKDRNVGLGSRDVTKKQKDSRSTPARIRHILRLLCPAHNRLAAEKELGREYMEAHGEVLQERIIEAGRQREAGRYSRNSLVRLGICTIEYIF